MFPRQGGHKEPNVISAVRHSGSTGSTSIVLPVYSGKRELGGWCVPFSRGSIDICHEKKVDLGFLRGADHDGRVLVSPFSTLDGVCVKFKVTLKLW